MDIVTNNSSLKPQMPTAPTKEALEMKFDATTSPLLGDDGDNTVITDGKGNELKSDKPEIVKEIEKEEKKVEEPVATDAPVKEEPKKEEAPKTGLESVLKAPKEEKKVDATKKEVPPAEKKETTAPKPFTPVKDKNDAIDTFDYTKYSPTEQTTLKNMSRQSREVVAKLIDENKQLATLKDATYLQHEEAYTLNPEFTALQRQSYFAQTEGQAWEKALLDIRAGKKFRQPVGRNPQTGELIMSEELPPTDHDDIRIGHNLNACIHANQQTTSQLQQYPIRYKQQIQQDLSTIEQVRGQKFAWVADPKLLEHTINVEGKGEQKLGTVIQEFKDLFPAYLRNQVGVKVAADLMASLIIQGEELKLARNSQYLAETKHKEVSRAEPSSDNVELPVKSKIPGVPSAFTLAGSPLEQ